MTRLAVVALFLAACGDDGGTTTVDAKLVDSPPANKVVEIGCPATPAATVMTTDASNSYMPSAVTVAVNGIVKFTTSLAHNVEPNQQTTTDPGLAVGFNTTKCLQFKATGTFGFKCGPHGFTGTVTVN